MARVLVGLRLDLARDHLTEILVVLDLVVDVGSEFLDLRLGRYSPVQPRPRFRHLLGQTNPIFLDVPFRERKLNETHEHLFESVSLIDDHEGERRLAESSYVISLGEEVGRVRNGEWTDQSSVLCLLVGT